MKRSSSLNTPQHRPVRCPARHPRMLAKPLPRTSPPKPQRPAIYIQLHLHLQLQWPTDGCRRQRACSSRLRQPISQCLAKQHEPEPLLSGPRRRDTMSLFDVLFLLRSHRSYGKDHATSDRRRRWPWGSRQTCHVSNTLPNSIQLTV